MMGNLYGRRQIFGCVFGLWGALVSGMLGAGEAPGVRYAELLSARYAPYADWASALDPQALGGEERGRYWRTPEEVKAGRSADDPPLAGLRLAIDPGHVGGRWAKTEGREFRIHGDDFLIREGELVLKVARIARKRLEALGAEVALLREADEPINPRTPGSYVGPALEQVEPPKDGSFGALADYALAVRDRATALAVVGGEIQARAERVNRVLKPDALLSLHINAAPWPATEDGALRLVERNHSHVLIFGCVTSTELDSRSQRERLIEKLVNGSGTVEMELGRAFAGAQASEFQLEASRYDGRNAVRPEAGEGQLWARNLMLLRLVDCPTVLLEPFLANSEEGYAWLQEALAVRARGGAPGESDILVRYADAVVEGVLSVYGTGE